MSAQLRRAALIVAVASSLAAPATASAAGTIGSAGGVLSISPGATDDLVYLEQISASDVYIWTYRSTFDPPTGGCENTFTEPFGVGSYKRYHCATGGALTKIVVNAGEGNDQVGIWSGNESIPFQIEGGQGNDYLYGGKGGDQISGGAGNDFLGGDLGNDTLDGGEDSDDLIGNGGADDMTGGGGFDQVLYYDKGSAQPLSISLNDAADDGESGESDNVRSSIEDIRGGEGADVISGSGAPNEIDGSGGADIIDGGAGVDRFNGGHGDDRVLSRDGNAERVDCGADADTATSDTVDEVAGCETNNASSDLQADRDGDGFAAPTDCNDTSAAIKPGASDTPDDGIDQDCSGADAQNLDRDGDGFNRDVDCDDNNAAAKPGAPEIVGNTADENCDGFAPPTPVIETPVFPGFFFLKGVTTVTKAFGVGELDSGVKVTVRCKGKKRAGCPKRKTVQRTTKKKTKRLSFYKYYRRAKLRKGATIEVEITKPGFVGRFIRFKVKPRAVPTPQVLCIFPGDPKAKAC